MCPGFVLSMSTSIILTDYVIFISFFVKVLVKILNVNIFIVYKEPIKLILFSELREALQRYPSSCGYRTTRYPALFNLKSSKLSSKYFTDV